MHPLVPVLAAEADVAAARQLARYFQVRPGGYGEGDEFLGVRLSRLRVLARPYTAASFEPGDWAELLDSPLHEHRLIALVVMSQRAKRLLRRPEPDDELTRLVDTYLAHTSSINNWDLVDVSAGPVLGGSLLDRERRLLDGDRSVLDRLARSPSLWERRIAMVSTQQLIAAGQDGDVYRLAELLLADPEDLIHKAVGWMLREAGVRVDVTRLRRFLDAHAREMPRTMLRQAIERFAPLERQQYLSVGHER